MTVTDKPARPVEPGRGLTDPAPRPSPLSSPDVQMALVLAAAGFHLGALGVIIVLVAGDLGVPVSSLAWMGSIFGVALLGMALFGPVVLRLGVNRVLAVATAVAAVGLVLIAVAPTLPLVALGAGLQAVGGSATVLVVPTLLTGPNASVRITRVNAVSSVVGVVAPLLVGAMIAASLNGRLALVLAALPMMLVSVVAARASRTPEPLAEIPPAPGPTGAEDPGDTPAQAPDDTLPETSGASHAVPSGHPQAPDDTLPETSAVSRTSPSGHPQTPGDTFAPAPGEELPPGPDDVVERLSKRLVLRRWLAIVVAVSAEFSFIVWAVARLVDSGLDTGLAATVGAAFPIGMAVGRVFGPWVIAHLPAVPVGAGVAAVGTVLVVVGPTWPVIAAGLLLAGLGIATFYPVTLVHLMGVPRLPQSVGSSLGALASGTAITLAPAGLALLGSAMELRLAYLVVLPLLGALVLLHGRGR